MNYKELSELRTEEEFHKYLKEKETNLSKEHIETLIKQMVQPLDESSILTFKQLDKISGGAKLYIYLLENKRGSLDVRDVSGRPTDYSPFLFVKDSETMFTLYNQGFDHNKDGGHDGITMRKRLIPRSWLQNIDDKSVKIVFDSKESEDEIHIFENHTLIEKIYTIDEFKSSQETKKFQELLLSLKEGKFDIFKNSVDKKHLALDFIKRCM